MFNPRLVKGPVNLGCVQSQQGKCWPLGMLTEDIRSPLLPSLPLIPMQATSKQALELCAAYGPGPHLEAEP